LDKYEYNEKAKQINDRIEEKDYMAAARIADEIDWKRVKSVKMLTNVGSAYAEIGRYEDAKEIFLIAFQRAPMGRRLAYKLTELSIIAGKIEEAEMYYQEFLEIAPKDISRYELLYKLEKKNSAEAYLTNKYRLKYIDFILVSFLFFSNVAFVFLFIFIPHLSSFIYFFIKV